VRVVLYGAAFVLVLLSIARAQDTQIDDVSFDTVAAKLAAPAVLRGSFRQTRHLQLISKPLRSSGRFLLSDMGLYWEQDEPLKSVMIADGERLLQRIGDGPLQTIDVARNPVVLTFSQSFLSIFKGSEDELRSHFDLEFLPEDGAADGWMIVLTPTSYPMSEAIASINISGREYIEELKVNSRSSEETIITFSNLQTEPDELTEHEIELYAR
jgi:outer membrane lipoprotein-sorting protein